MPAQGGMIWNESIIDYLEIIWNIPMMIIWYLSLIVGYAYISYTNISTDKNIKAPVKIVSQLYTNPVMKRRDINILGVIFSWKLN